MIIEGISLIKQKRVELVASTMITVYLKNTGFCINSKVQVWFLNKKNYFLFFSIFKMRMTILKTEDNCQDLFLSHFKTMSFIFIYLFEFLKFNDIVIALRTKMTEITNCKKQSWCFPLYFPRKIYTILIFDLNCFF